MLRSTLISACGGRSGSDLRKFAMSSWSVEKNLSANRSLEERRKRYTVKRFVTLEEVPPWSAPVARPKTAPLERDVEKFKGFALNADLNERLAAKVSVWAGDITTLEIDAVVNAANSGLRGGGGVDGAIHRAAGPHLPEECKEIGGCPAGQARMTGGYLMPAKYIIHTVGPTDKSREKLIGCYRSCFALQRLNRLRSIAFPCIGTGVYNFPNVEAAHVACSEARRFLEEDAREEEPIVDRIIFCVFEPKDVDIYNSVAQLYFPLE